MGYYLAGFRIVGVDIKPQPHYPFEFHRADALEYVAEHGHEFDAIHASPPCQKYSTMTQGLHKNRIDIHPDLIAPTRQLLIQCGRHYVIENVEGARRLLRYWIMLCGTMFGLQTQGGNELRRHRYFELSFFMLNPLTCKHSTDPIGVYGGNQSRDYHNPPRRPRTIGVWGNAGGRSKRDGLVQFGTRDRQDAMGIDWVGGKALSQAIPPAYTEFIGKQLMRVIRKT